MGASSLTAFDRLAIGVQMGSRQLSISSVSRDYDVTRKFARCQRDTAARMIEEMERRVGTASVVTVDEAFMERLVVAAALLCNCPFRRIIELCKAMFGHAPGLGTTHNICRKAIDRAKESNSAEKLDGIRHPAIDEIFQKSTPVFAAVRQRCVPCTQGHHAYIGVP